MSSFSYLASLRKLAKDIQANYDMIREKIELVKKPAAAKDVLQTWPVPLRSYFSEMNGCTIHWRHFNFEDKPHVCGSVGLQSADKVARNGKGLIWFDHIPKDSALRHFRIVDFFVDEAAAGFFDNDFHGEMHLYFFEGDPQPLGVDFEGYVKLLCEARGFFYWQQVLVAFQEGSENQESKDFKTYMPLIFRGFSFDDFAAMYDSLQIGDAS